MTCKRTETLARASGIAVFAAHCCRLFLFISWKNDEPGRNWRENTSEDGPPCAAFDENYRHGRKFALVSLQPASRRVRA